MITEKTFTDSKVVSKIQYKETEKAMLVTFLNGKTFAYLNVPSDVFQQALDAHSIGSFVQNVIKKEYHVKALN